MQLSSTHLNRFTPERFANSPTMMERATVLDMLHVTFLPVTEHGVLVGGFGLRGNPELKANDSSALVTLGYILILQWRSLSNMSAATHPTVLTAREREVLGLAAEGLTAQEIADRLGMSPRTVTQHVDNAAGKLGTRNRTHTVAEAIRRDLVH